MHDVARLFTPAEAGAVSGLALKAVNNAIDKRIIDLAERPARPRAGAGPSRRLLTGEDLVRLRLWYGIGPMLVADRRRRLFAEMAANPAAQRLKADDLVVVDVGAARRQVAARVRELDAAEKAIHRDRGVMGADPVFKGTRIGVYAIAEMLAAGVDEAELLSGYPALDARKLAQARIWSAAHPRRGRPRHLADQGLVAVSSTRRALKPDPLAAPPGAAAARR